MASYLRKKLQYLTASPPPETDDVAVENKANRENSADVEEIERSKIGIVRALVQNQNPSSKDVDDLMIRRFLRARDHDVEKASAMLLKYVKWRAEFVSDGFVSPSKIATHLAHDKMFMQGYDKRGRPIVVVFAARHKPENVEELKDYSAYSLDKICSRMPSGQEKFVAIADLDGWGYANSDVRGYLAILSILQDYYPERLGKLFVLNVPYIFMAVWRIVHPFIDKNTKKKIVFVESSKTLSTLLEDIDESQIPDSFGGKLKLVLIQDC